MYHQPIDAAAVHPASKWTPEVQARFLEHLSRKGNVRAACLLVGASTETAYRLRRRDPVFARGWEAAMVHARRAAELVLADRAIDGVVEDIYYRGEWVGSRRKFDSRLLLAHLARLDRQVKPEAELDAERFDEILAVILGEPIPAAFEGDDEHLAVGRERFAEGAALAARLDAEARDRAAREDEEDDTALSAEERWERDDAREAGYAEAEQDAHAEARWEWDRWHAGICEAVDAALAGPDEDAEEADETPEAAAKAAAEAPGGGAEVSLRTVSTVSTPRRAEGAQNEGAAPADDPSSASDEGPRGPSVP